jgi:hypothetical protein
VAGSGTSRAGFEAPPKRELSRLPISDIIKFATQRSREANLYTEGRPDLMLGSSDPFTGIRAQKEI